VADVQAASERKQSVVGRRTAADSEQDTSAVQQAHMYCTRVATHVQVLATWESTICKQQKEQSQVQEHCAGLVTTTHTEQAYSLQFTQSRLSHYDRQKMPGYKAAASPCRSQLVLSRR